MSDCKAKGIWGGKSKDKGNSETSNSINYAETKYREKIMKGNPTVLSAKCMEFTHETDGQQNYIIMYCDKSYEGRVQSAVWKFSRGTDLYSGGHGRHLNQWHLSWDMQDNKVKNGLARASNTCKDSGREEFVEKRKHMWVELGEKERECWENLMWRDLRTEKSLGKN